MGKKLFIVLCAAAILAYGYALHAGLIEIPHRWNPWAPLEIAAEPNFLTRYKLSRLSDGALCMPVLAQAQMQYEPVADRITGEGCGFHNAVRITATSAEVSEPFTLSCRSAVALAMWEYHVVQPAAQSRFGRRVASLQHYGSYACRNIYSREGAHRSQHATADALNVAGFVLADGRRITVQGGWKGDEPDVLFLRDVHAGACKFFDAALGPEYNAAHFNHFYLDRGSHRICR